MNKILYIPIDERPCNAIYPIEAAKVAKELSILTPDLNLLGNKKKPADVDELWAFIDEHIMQMDAMVLSTEMLLYGGLLPSRLHQMREPDIAEYEKRIRNLKRRNPRLKIYLSNLIMRTPRYNSSDEEPDYYQEFGESIFRIGWLKDQKNREGLSVEEQEELDKLVKKVPMAYIVDYETRRAFNVSVNEKNCFLIEEKIIDFLVIPQDDSAEYGYTAIDQKKVYSHIVKENLSEKIMVYPGADEVGWTLLGRAFNEFKNQKPKVYPIYSSTLGPTLVPMYEDRIIHESLKAHIMSAGCELVENSEECDFILGYNTPGKVMQDSWDQFEDKDVSYTSFRHLLTFVEQLAAQMDKQKPVALCDSAFANGGDVELIQLLDKRNLLLKLISYKGWNTNCNSLGSSLMAAIVALDEVNEEQLKKNLVMHIYEDVFYQSIVRMNVTKNLLPQLHSTYFDIEKNKYQVIKEIEKGLEECCEKYLVNTKNTLGPVSCIVDSPWNRMFEIHCKIEL